MCTALLAIRSYAAFLEIPFVAHALAAAATELRGSVVLRGAFYAAAYGALLFYGGRTGHALTVLGVAAADLVTGRGHGLRAAGSRRALALAGTTQVSKYGKQLDFGC